MDWFTAIQNQGLAVVLIVAGLAGAWWVLRQTLGQNGWARALAARAVEAFSTFLSGLSDVQARQLALEEKHFEATGRLSDCAETLRQQHEALTAAGLHACDVAEAVCLKLQIDQAGPLAAIREALRRKGGP